MAHTGITETQESLTRQWIAQTREAFRGDGLDVAVWSAVVVALATMMFSIAIAQAAVLIAGILWLAGLWRRPAMRPRRTPLFWCYAAFVAARVLAIPTSIDPATSIAALRTEIPFHILFFVVLATFDIRKTERILFLIRLLVLAGVVATAIGFARYGLGMDERLTSTTAGYYTLGMFLASVFAIAFAFGRRREVFPNRLLWMAVCVFLLAGLLFTFNRLHWVVAGVAALVIGAMRERRILAVLAVLGVIAMLTVAPLQERFLQLLDAGGNMSGRDVLWRGAWMIADQHPLTGFGPRTFPLIFPLFDVIPDKGVGSWHNDYLQVYMDSGLIALLPLLATLTLVGGHARRALRGWAAGSLAHDTTIAFSVMVLGFVLAGGMLDALLSMLFRTGIAILALLALGAPAVRQRSIESETPKGGRDA
ncbi:MAG: O-antigen ligase family protein [Bacteroidota bacterium]|jgi:O-antigen ligase|nr:O-antigen ligase family protein [Bacteroidota bacterium]